MTKPDATERFVLDDSLLNSDWTKVGQFDFPSVQTVEDFEREFYIPQQEPARSEKLAHLAQMVWADAAPEPIRELLLSAHPSRKRAQAKVDAIIDAAFIKASFGGDRSAAGRYAAEQRWKDHVRAEPKREQVFNGNLGEAVDKTVATMTGVPRNEMTDFMREMGASSEGSIGVLFGKLDKILEAKHSPAEILAAKLAAHALLKVGESFKHQHEDKAIDAYGRVAHLPAVVNAKTVEELVTAIENTPEFRAGEENMVSLGGLVRERLSESAVGHKQAYRHVRHIISLTIGYWNMGGASKKSIWQEIVAREFGLTEQRPNKPETAHAAEVREILDQRLPGSAGVFGTMARAVYEQAQTILRQSLPAGTTHVILHRGTGLTDKELQDAQNGSLRIAPITSFTTDLALTERYGAELKQEAKHTVAITAKVPVSQIFGLFAQNFGYLSEKEVVVLGPSAEVETVTMRDIMQKAHARVDAMISAALQKASFGGDRSAAGRYAAEQRWKNHVKSDKPVWRDFREVLATMPRDRREVFADGVREQASQMTDEELEREWKSIDPVEVLMEDDVPVGIAIEESVYAKIRKKTLAEEMARRKVLARQSGIIEHVRRENGMSVSMETGEEPKQGFMVARKEGSVIMDAAKFFDAIEGKKALSDFIKANRERLGAGVYLGIWYNQKNGKVYLDVVDNVIGQSDAERMGRERNQIAIWDVVNKVEIQTGGTGEG